MFPSQFTQLDYCTKVCFLVTMRNLASPADILRRASRVPSPRGEGTRDARLRMSAGEAIRN